MMVRGLSQRPNPTEGPAATRDFWRSTKEEEEEEEGMYKFVCVYKYCLQLCPQFQIKNFVQKLM
jgi:hypothetical protein